eukprot:645610-Pyramimonas_sp.AAC.1
MEGRFQTLAGLCQAERSKYAQECRLPYTPVGQGANQKGRGFGEKKRPEVRLPTVTTIVERVSSVKIAIRNQVCNNGFFLQRRRQILEVPSRKR